MRIKYVGPVSDSSGYAEAARMNIRGLLTAGVEVTIKNNSFEGEASVIDDLTHLVDIGIDYDTVVTHLTPNNYPFHTEEGKKNIGITVWETTHIPSSWVAECNKMDRIIVPCEQNVQSFRSSGVKVPILRVPHAIEVNNAPPAVIKGFEGVYKFYSIFQWTERKNPIGLLRAYFAEFSADEPVCLVLKTYSDFTKPLPPQVKELLNAVKSIRNAAGLKSTPPVVLVVKNMTKDEVWALHAGCDAFVLPHRAEGFGLPIAEAMALGKPVIATTFGGPNDFMTTQNSFRVGYKMTPVFGMPWIADYDGRQWWSEPDLEEVTQNMRHVYTDRAYAVELGRQAQEDMQKYSVINIGKQLVKALEV